MIFIITQYSLMSLNQQLRCFPNPLTQNLRKISLTLAAVVDGIQEEG